MGKTFFGLTTLLWILPLFAKAEALADFESAVSSYLLEEMGAPLVQAKAEELWQSYPRKTETENFWPEVHALRNILNELELAGHRIPQRAPKVRALAKVMTQSVVDVTGEERLRSLIASVNNFTLQHFATDLERDNASKELVESLLRGTLPPVRTKQIFEAIEYSHGLSMPEFRSNLASLTNALSAYRPERSGTGQSGLKYAVKGALLGGVIAGALGVSLVGGGEVLVDALSVLFSITRNPGAPLDVTSVTMTSATFGAALGALLSSMANESTANQWRQSLLEIISSIDRDAYDAGLRCSRLSSANY